MIHTPESFRLTFCVGTFKPRQAERAGLERLIRIRQQERLDLRLIRLFGVNTRTRRNPT